MDPQKEIVNWKRLIITTLLVVVASAITSSITWFILDRTFNESQQTNAALVATLEKKITYLDTRLGGSTNVEAEEGIIEGSLTYPSQGIPTDIQIVAEDITTGKTFQTTDQITDTKYTYGKGFKLTVPIGSYYVYGTHQGFNGTDGKQWKAYYNQFVVCGMSVDCKDYTKVIVKVEAEKTTAPIMVGDWYPTKS